LSGFSICILFGNLSQQYVNLMNCMTFVEVGVREGWMSVGAPSTHSMSSLSLARHVHVIVGHVQWSSHCGIVLSCGLKCWLHAFMSV
jgi:hypothetical protein